jgi:uncharacterized protein YkwD
MRNLLAVSLLFPIITLFAKQPSPLREHVSATAIIHEINLARQNPSLYARFLQETSYSGNFRVLSDGDRIRMHEGVRAVEEAIRFLRGAQPRPPLAFSTGLCRAAADHCREQADGAMGHNGRDGSDPASRINRYGKWQGAWAENIAYGKRSARDIVLALIIDDGVRSRGHRKNIFNSNYSVAGAAYGPHARFGTVCDVDFASAYAESALVSAN